MSTICADMFNSCFYINRANIHSYKKNTCVKLSKHGIAVGWRKTMLALRSGSTIANEVYPRRGYC